MEIEPTVFVGVDWASTEHQVCVIGSNKPEQRTFAHSADGIGALVDWLISLRASAGEIAVAIETPHGPVVEALMDRGVQVFAINRKQLAQAPGSLPRPPLTGRCKGRPTRRDGAGVFAQD